MLRHPSARFRVLRALIAAVLLLPWPALPQAAGGPLIVVDIAPVGALVRDVAGADAEIHVLVPPGASPHDLALKPSDMRALSRADLIVWLGPRAMANLQAAMARVPARVPRLALLELPGTTLWPRRRPGLFAAARPRQGPPDPHAWLDPGNGRLWARAIAAALNARDPAGAAARARRLADLLERLRAVETALRARLAPPLAPFVQYHDAFQYFERRFGLEPLGAATTDTDLPPALGVIRRLRRAMADRPGVCLFLRDERQLGQARALAGMAGTRVAYLDPVAVPDAGPMRYAAMIEAVGNRMAACLRGVEGG